MSNITMGRARVRRRVKTEMARLGSCVGHVAVGLMYGDGRRRVECRRRCLSRHLLDRRDRRAGISRTTDGIHHRAMQLIRRPASYHCAGRAGGRYERGAEKQSVCTGEPWHVARPAGAASIVWSPSHQSPAEARRFTRSRRVHCISIEL